MQDHTEPAHFPCPNSKDATGCMHCYRGVEFWGGHWRHAALPETSPERHECEAILFLRSSYSAFGGRSCPACHYTAGVFVRACVLHEEIARLNRVIDQLNSR